MAEEKKMSVIEALLDSNRCPGYYESWSATNDDPLYDWLKGLFDEHPEIFGNEEGVKQ
jgi:hypothetical protein